MAGDPEQGEMTSGLRAPVERPAAGRHPWRAGDGSLRWSEDGAVVDPSFRSAFSGTFEALGKGAVVRRSALLALYSALCLAAALVALAALAALIGSDPGLTNRALRFVDAVGPAGAVPSLRGGIADAIRDDVLAAVTLVPALIVVIVCGLGYLAAFRRAVRGGAESTKSTRRRARIVEVVLVAVVAVVFAAVIVGLVLTGPSAHAAIDALGGGHRALTIWSVGKWPLIGCAFAALFLGLRRFVWPRWEEPDSVSNAQLGALVLWGLAVGGFTLYLLHFQSVDETYGSLGATVVSLLWLGLFSVLYYATPGLRLDGFGTVIPGLAISLICFLGISAGLAIGAASLDSFKNVSGSLALGGLLILWFWLSNLALLFGTAFNLVLGRRPPPPPLEIGGARRAITRRRSEEMPVDDIELERIVRIALADDTAHSGMWSALPGGPDEAPARLTDLECDLNDWGFAYGVAWAVARSRYPLEPERSIAERALRAARTVFREYCAGEDWSERLADRDELPRDPVEPR